MIKKSPFTVLGFCLVLTMVLTACAGSQHIAKGDIFFKQKDYTKAIESYEQALREFPDDKLAWSRVRRTRRAAVLEKINQAQNKLSEGYYPTALKYGLQARRMPLDLEDVDLVRKIDRLITKSAQLAEEKVGEWMKMGHYLRAVGLSQRIVDASPGISSREAWADEVQAKAVRHYLRLAKEFRQRGMNGTASVQLALAKRLGGQVKPSRVQSSWKRFTSPSCFSEPLIQIKVKKGKSGDLVSVLNGNIKKSVAGLRQNCESGTKQLQVLVDIAEAKIVDDKDVVEAAKPLPGVNIKTEEIYYVEEPYTEIEEYTVEEVRVRNEKRRDCAPRPGQPRGCREWVEKIEERIPVTKKRKVEKIRKIEKRRPIKEELPDDKVLKYEETTITRQVAFRGQLKIAGAIKSQEPFDVVRESKDSGHPRAEKQGLLLPEDTVEVRPLEELMQEATEALTKKISLALDESIATWVSDVKKQAQMRVNEGQLPQAEELYLKLLLWGAGDDDELKTFFRNRYGQTLMKILAYMQDAMGREVLARKAEKSSTKSRIPQRGVPKSGRAPIADSAKEDRGDSALVTLDSFSRQNDEAALENTDNQEAEKTSEEETSEEDLSAEEMQALEDESLESGVPAPAPETENSEQEEVE
jgi:hypothetical protein